MANLRDFAHAPSHARTSVVFVLLLTASLFTPVIARAEEGLAEQATAAYRAGDFGHSAELFQQAIESGDTDPALPYNAACALALAGREDAAIAQLKAAIRNGFFNTRQLELDPDLESLRKRPDWSTVMQLAQREQVAENKRWGADVFASPYRPTLTETEKQAGLALIWAEARYGFANFDISSGAQNWNARYLEFIPRVSAAKTTIDYYWELKAFIAGLHDGHSNVSFPPEVRNGLYGRPPMRTERVGDDVVITRVLDSSLPVQVGEVIRTINGQPVDEYAGSHVAPYVSASTPQDRNVRIYDYELLFGPADQPLTLGIVDADGGSRSVTVSRRHKKSTGQKKAANSQNSDVPFQLRWEPNDIAYVQLKSFNSMETANLWHQHYEEIRQRARGIVLDVRDNGGGNSGIGYAVLADLIEQPTKTSSQELAVYRSTLRAWGFGQRRDPLQVADLSPSGNPHFKGPVAVLIGPHTYSAAEDFVVAFEMAKRGKLIGSATGGSTGQPLMFLLPGGGSARICTKRDRFADGREFVGVGIQPDIEVHATLKSIRAGEDPVLERALDWVDEQRHTP